MAQEIFQVYCNRGDGWTLDGCWGSEDTQCGNPIEAERCCAFLSGLFPYASWGYVLLDEEGYPMAPVTRMYEAIVEKEE